MSIDGVKLNISHLTEIDLKDHKDLKKLFTGKSKKVESKIVEFYPYKASIDTLQFIIRGRAKNKETKELEERNEIKGSLHKYHNNCLGNGNHNHNDFFHYHLVDVVNDLHCRFGIDPEKTKVSNLEIGVNINTDILLKDLFRSHVIGYNGLSHHTKIDFNDKGEYTEYKRSSNSKIYYKFYDKGSQYGIAKSTLRWEKKFLRSNLLLKFGLYSLANLTDRKVLCLLSIDLFDDFKKIIIVDDLKPNLKGKQLSAFKNYINPKWWDSRKSMNRSTRLRDRRDCAAFLKLHELDTIKTRLLEQIEKKLIELLECNKSHTLIDALIEINNATNHTLHIGVKGCIDKRQ